MWQRIQTHTQMPGRTVAHIVALFLTLTQAHETGKDSTNKQKEEKQEHLNAVCWLQPKITSDVEQEAHFSLLMTTLNGYAAVPMKIIMTLFTADKL